jgi:hypothetical protein
MTVLRLASSFAVLAVVTAGATGVARAEEAPAVPAAAPASAPVAAPVAVPVAAPVGAPVIELHADDGNATIERRTGTSSLAGIPLVDASVASVAHWEQACVAPCALRLDPRYTYRVAGDGLVPSGSFALPRNGDRVRVDAKMGSQTGRLLGIGMTGLGALGVVTGGLAVGAFPILDSQDVGSRGFRTAVLAGGLSVLAVGLVTGITGLYLWLSNGSSATPSISSGVASAGGGGAARPAWRLLPNGAVSF